MSSKEIFSNESAELFAELTAGELQLLLLRHIQEILVQLQIRNQASLEYVPRLVPDISSAVSLEELYKSVLQAAEQHEAGQSAPTCEKEYSFGATPVEPLSSIIRGINNTLESIELLRYWALIMKYRQKLLEEEPRASLCCINVTTVDIGTIVTFKQGTDSMIQLRPEVEQELQKETRCQTFLSMVCSLLHHLREKNWAPTTNEFLCIEAAYNLLEQGYRLPASYCSVGDPGQRKHQTLLSITDPGPDNIRVTTRSEKLLDGVIVHTEYIDRGKEGDKQIIEAYRLPSHIWAAKVRLHVGDAAPCSAYIGRPVFEGLGLEGDLTNVIYKEHSIDLFKAALLKTVHTIASACSIMFAHGICDCKIAMERMTGEQMIEFMKAVRGNVIRNKDRQVLAAAFNLFMPILYRGAMVTEPFEIAKLGIQLASLGGFDKVTWDAARDEKSPHDKPEPITKVLAYHQMLELVHLAHEKGMLTYFSAGIGLDNIRDIVFTGVDGIGIGTYLHYKTEGKSMGALSEERVLNVITARNSAEVDINGQAAKVLARLDYSFFEKTLSGEEDELRLQLFGALKEGNANELKNLVKAIGWAEPSHFQCQSKALSRAQRTLNRKDLLVTGTLQELGLEKPLKEAFDNQDVTLLQKCFKLLDSYHRPNVE